MPDPAPLLVLAAAALLGAAVGAMLAWALAHGRARQRLALAAAEAEAARAGLAERARALEARLADTGAELAALRAEATRLHGERASLERALAEERRGAGEKLAVLDAARERLSDAFKALASDALARNSQAFLDAAREGLLRLQATADGEWARREQALTSLVAPLAESLSRVDAQVRALEQARGSAYGALVEQLRGVAETQEGLRRETANLVRALRAPQARGQWGELQLRRAVELAGLVERCDFDEQVTRWRGDQAQRPDLVVHLPGGKEVVVDAKAPLAAYLEAAEAGDEGERTARLADHARQVREHVRRLAAKSYWESFEEAPDFVVLFLPGEHFLGAALAADPTLLEEAFRQRVILATPTTLVALLKSVAYGWQQEAIAVNAREIGAAARELYDRLRIFAGHLDRVGAALAQAVDQYNRAAGSFAGRLLPQGRRLEDLGASAEAALAAPRTVESAPRVLPATPDRDAGE